MRKIFSGMCLSILVFLLCMTLPISSRTVHASGRIQDVGEKLVIVIDPGHGGENLGTIDGETDENIMTLVTAQAMYDELVKYDNVQIFMTRTEDVDLSLKERAEFARKVEADFLFSIHYNASESNALYGSEVWVSTFSPYNAYGYQFGYEFLTAMRELGLFNRGVKTRLSTKELDYYGIIRECVTREIPALIIEHCHVDIENDIPFCDTEEEWKHFGIADATAVAKYFGLKSKELQVDYSDYELVKVAKENLVPQTQSDKTEPDVCHIDLVSADFDTCTLKLSVTGSDADSPMMTYSYSLDGGETFTARQPWPGCNTLTGKYQNNFTLTIDVPSGMRPSVIVRGYNMFDLHTDSNVYASQYEFRFPETESSPAPNEYQLQVEEVKNVSEDVESEIVFTPWELAKLLLVTAIIILSMIVICQLIVHRSFKTFRRRHFRNEYGNSQNHPK